MRISLERAIVNGNSDPLYPSLAPSFPFTGDFNPKLEEMVMRETPSTARAGRPSYVSLRVKYPSAHVVRAASVRRRTSDAIVTSQGQNFHPISIH